MVDSTMPPTDHSLPRDTIHRLLAEPRRRLTLAVLADRETPVDLDALARDVATSEQESESQPVPSERVRAVTVLLHHNHLPRLDAHAVVEYDPAPNVVDTARNFDDIAPRLVEGST